MNNEKLEDANMYSIRLNLESLGFWLIMPKIVPKLCQEVHNTISY
jgi:hypothetical protein